jgi:hypothetical protein
MVLFLLCLISVCTILEKVIQVSERFLPTLKGLCAHAGSKEKNEHYNTTW